MNTGSKDQSKNESPFPNERGLYWRDVVYEVQKQSGQGILPHPPPIIFKDLELDKKYDSWPTDLLGTYHGGCVLCTGYHLPSNNGRHIEIYPNRIKICTEDLRNYNHNLIWDEKDLTIVVVVHELMHALLHLGFSRMDKNTPETEAEHFEYLQRRHGMFSKIGSGYERKSIVELHAQLGTWFVLSRGGKDKTPSGGPAKAFLDLMKRQPKEYVIPDKLLSSSPENLWIWTALVQQEWPLMKSFNMMNEFLGLEEEGLDEIKPETTIEELIESNPTLASHYLADIIG